MIKVFKSYYEWSSLITVNYEFVFLLTRISVKESFGLKNITFKNSFEGHFGLQKEKVDKTLSQKTSFHCR